MAVPLEKGRGHVSRLLAPEVTIGSYSIPGVAGACDGSQPIGLLPGTLRPVPEIPAHQENNNAS